MEEAIAGLKEIDNSYKNHSKAAREIAEEFFDSDRCLNEMLEAS